MTTKPPRILIFAEQQDGTLKRSARELFALARRWPSASSAEVTAVTLGAGAERAAAEAVRLGAHQVRWLEETERSYAPLRWLRAVVSQVIDLDARVVLFPDSSTGRDLAPRLAARMACPFLSGAYEVRIVEGRLQIARPLFGGRFIEAIEPADVRPLVLTWYGRETPTLLEQSPDSGQIRSIQLADDVLDFRVRITAASATEGRDLSQADVVVCGGRGVGSKDGFQLVCDLAEAMGGAPAASRAAVDAGFAPPGLQVGQSGKTVNPRLYIALGVSGSLQHQAGMRNSRCVVAANSDPDAPIMRWADYAIVGDLKTVGAALLAALPRKGH